MRSNFTKRSGLPLVTACLAAVGASVCCVVPLVLVLLGISGAWIGQLTAFDAWRPWFTAATVVCLAWAFWALYGPGSHCGPDGGCLEPRVRSRRRRWLWIATGVIALLLLFPYYAHWFL